MLTVANAIPTTIASKTAHAGETQDTFLNHTMNSQAFSRSQSTQPITKNTSDTAYDLEHQTEENLAKDLFTSQILKDGEDDSKWHVISISIIEFFLAAMARDGIRKADPMISREVKPERRVQGTNPLGLLVHHQPHSSHEDAQVATGHSLYDEEKERCRKQELEQDLELKKLAKKRKRLF
ncbi:hypothetical protein DFQ30_000022 [Apophysomyces sp. BC1015]|nr:hypothetical protein DFQ30_000022 [Apophysomyces sp. BC1015]